MERLARLVVRFRVAVVLAYAVLVPLAAWMSRGVLETLKPGGFRNPVDQSTIVDEELRRFLSRDLIVLYQSRDVTVDDVVAWSTLVPTLAHVEADPGVEKLISFYSTGAPSLVSRDRKNTIVLLSLRGTDVEKVESARRLRPLLQADGFDVQLGGYTQVFEAITGTVERDLRRAELIALPLTLLLLLLLFRSLISAALPVILGGAAIAMVFAILRVLHAFFDVTIFAANTTTILGLGLAVDYSLFVLMRAREELRKNPSESGELRAVLIAMSTAGRAVAFSGMTVAVSLCGLFFFPHGVLRSIALGGIAVTLATVVLATTLLPALLSLLGRRVDALRIPFGLPIPTEDAEPRGLWRGIVTVVGKAPLVVAVAVVGALLLSGVPFARLAPSIADARALPKASEARAVQETIERTFEPHQATPIDIVIHMDDGRFDDDDVRALKTLVEKIGTMDGVAHVDSPLSFAPAPIEDAIRFLKSTDAATASAKAMFITPDVATDGSGGAAVRLGIVSRYDVDDDGAQAQVRAMRELTVPGMTLRVGGQSAWILDVRHALRTCTPRMVGFIVCAMLLVLFLVFGSVVLPIKAVAMNSLSLCASFGAIVWVFQDGRFGRLLGYESLGTTEASVPVLMFAIVFGLSMDYEVLLLSRIREEYMRDANNDNARAVARGLYVTGRLITSAALLLVVVVLAFATSELILVKTLAIGIAVAVALDAVVVRTLLVPATMTLLGHWNWWAPAPLKRLWEKLG